MSSRECVFPRFCGWVGQSNHSSNILISNIICVALDMSLAFLVSKPAHIILHVYHLLHQRQDHTYLNDA